VGKGGGDGVIKEKREGNGRSAGRREAWRMRNRLSKKNLSARTTLWEKKGKKDSLPPINNTRG